MGQETTSILENNDEQLAIATWEMQWHFIYLALILLAHLGFNLYVLCVGLLAWGGRGNYLPTVSTIILCLIILFIVALFPYRECFYFDKKAKTVTCKTTYFLQLSRRDRVLWHWQAAATIPLDFIQTIKIVRTKNDRYAVILSQEKAQSFARHLTCQSVYTIPLKSQSKSAIASPLKTISLYLWAEAKTAKLQNCNAVSLKAVYVDTCTEIVTALLAICEQPIVEIFQRNYPEWTQTKADLKPIQNCLEILKEKQIQSSLYVVNRSGSIVNVSSG
ncbi:MAG: hypothetical protein SAJ12_03870 [Jaaginema sp. PMC 1079.18]|nr:hypothetical protein [Jaaginema sp. PMC 1080.18]MEC4850127.1 hypothetical protein [Jaaginema sp. PMC 1079.18]MEC4866334.1 hypothetical protein [Jaaginema sp. PMC 1078.18]